jgi:DNA helicase-4
MILQCVSDISMKQYYGTTVLIDVLRGAESQRIMEKQLYKLEQYGALKCLSREDLAIIVEWMLDMHFVLKTKGQYPVLHPTDEGTHSDQLLTYSHLVKLHAKLTKK